ncbi:hypothetical protein D3C83_228870 [compost metagenome]
MEFEDGFVLVLDAEAGDALAAVDIERPHGNAPDAGDAGEEIAEGLAVVVILYFEYAPGA